MTKTQMMRQVSLQSVTEEGILQLTTYVNNSPQVRKGAQITLIDYKEPERVWTIVSISPHLIDKKDIHNGWENDI